MVMRVFVCEFVTGGGLRGRVAEGPFAGLRREGELMAGALAHDLTALPAVQVTLARDRALAPAACPAAVAPFRIDAEGPDQPWTAWADAIAAHDAVWPIAPETGGVLERLSRLVVASGRRLLGSSPAAVAVTAGKSATAHCLATAGVPVIPAFPPAETPPSAHGWIVKPDDGAGAEGVIFLADRTALDAWRAKTAAEGDIVQPFVPGDPCSLSLLCRDGQAWILSVNRQHIMVGADGAVRYRGGAVGALNHRAADLRPLAASIAAALPGLWGYVGVDIILGADGPVVVEINPRLTTSYVGLARVLGCNPAGLVLSLLTGDPAPPVPPTNRSATVAV